ncbi:hypothetical protein AVEN_155321-1 [Araneus ventricosus]|uniref:Uncharacterized protein n=1 Tax=Araneus ventricosus TaxID=182803 RepID=A0A4Y2WXG5_ARAVE|nr:hypothetical protein AVEN_155321-1 [Araneus ventricosus]
MSNEVFPGLVDTDYDSDISCDVQVYAECQRRPEPNVSSRIKVIPVVSILSSDESLSGIDSDDTNSKDPWHRRIKIYTDSSEEETVPVHSKKLAKRRIARDGNSSDDSSTLIGSIQKKKGSAEEIGEKSSKKTTGEKSSRKTTGEKSSRKTTIPIKRKIWKSQEIDEDSSSDDTVPVRRETVEGPEIDDNVSFESYNGVPRTLTWKMRDFYHIYKLYKVVKKNPFP